MRRGALTTLPPNTSTMDWCPRHTPNTGTVPANARIMSMETPASYGVPGPGEMHRCVGPQRLRLLHRDLVVAAHVDFRAENQERLHQVVGEGIVVVDQQQSHVHWHAHRPSAASLSARAIAPLLASTSSYSVTGTLSATMPAPAW